MTTNYINVKNIIKRAIRTCNNIQDDETAKFIENSILGPVKKLEEDEKYNGWTNYATWKVNLELLDGEADAVRDSGDTFATVRDLADHLKQMVDDYFELNLQEVDPNGNNYAISVMHDFSGSFLESVNWQEIAQHMAIDNPEFLKEAK